MPTTPKYPNVSIVVDTSGPDGNIFVIVGKAYDAMILAGVPEEKAYEIWLELESCVDYEDAKSMVKRYVNADLR